MCKKIKDPIYGYIEISDSYLSVLDSACFQRLRDIIQTSYTSIYPSALHNRFAHSLGVFWLGNLAFDAFIKNTPELLDKNVENIKNTFLMACLCHDIGHSPFSHSGEKFYDKVWCSVELNKIVDDETYAKDLKEAGEIVGHEHEIMSALIALQTFGELIGKENFSLFARSIIGLKYQDNQNADIVHRLECACVEMLNSDIIDVDKLDYLIRDSYMSGYESMSIDYKRLLSGVFVNTDGYPIGYEKKSLSVLESVLTANDMERRWIQSHPVILYESYLIQTIIRELGNEYNDKKKPNSKLFSIDALKTDGVKIKKENFRLLSDADILYLAKKEYDNSHAIKEYFNRSERRHPIWKSEAEFSCLYDFKKNSIFVEILLKWENDLIEGKYGTYSLNDTYLKSLRKEASSLKKIFNQLNDDSQIKTYSGRLERLNQELKLLSSIRKYLRKNHIDFDLVIVSTKQFKSNIYKSSFKNLPIRFNNISSVPSEMHDVTFLPLDTQEDDRVFFYLYYKRGKDEINVLDFSKELQRIAII